MLLSFGEDLLSGGVSATSVTLAGVSVGSIDANSNNSVIKVVAGPSSTATAPELLLSLPTRESF